MVGISIAPSRVRSALGEGGRGERQLRLLPAVGIALAAGLLGWVPEAGAETSTTPGSDLRADTASQVAADPEALRQLDAVEAEIRDLRTCSPSCLDALDELRRRLGHHERVAALQRAAYVHLRDWDALATFYEQEAAAGRSIAERVDFASVYYRAGRYEEAESIFRELADEAPDEPDLARRHALVLFQLGKHQEMLDRLAATEGKLSGTPASEAELLRGLVAFYRQDNQRALTHLERALELNADFVPAFSALTRVLSAEGQTDRARNVAERAEALRQAASAEISRKMRLSARSRLTSEACMARSWDECERLVHEMLTEANRGEKVGIYRYLGSILTSMGRPAEAARALEQADALGSQEAQP